MLADALNRYTRSMCSLSIYCFIPQPGNTQAVQFWCKNLVVLFGGVASLSPDVGGGLRFRMVKPSRPRHYIKTCDSRESIAQPTAEVANALISALFGVFFPPDAVCRSYIQLSINLQRVSAVGLVPVASSSQ